MVVVVDADTGTEIHADIIKNAFLVTHQQKHINTFIWEMNLMLSV